MNNSNSWPALEYNRCRDSLETLHMKMQIIGKIKLAFTPYLNHWWNSALYINASGITTGLIPAKNFAFEITFDFTEHQLVIKTTENKVKFIPLLTGSVAGFYGEIMSMLKNLGIDVTINPMPAEVPDPIRCDEDERSVYLPEYIHNWWRVLVNAKLVFEKFRTPFGGKSSPVHFFWGSFDLNHARFSGKPATPPNYGGRIMSYAENEENFSCGFWHGSGNYPKPAFYAYMYPAPVGIENVKLNAKSASYNSQLGEFILDYDDVIKSEKPENMILDFLNSAYEQSARLAGWDLNKFKAKIPH